MELSEVAYINKFLHMHAYQLGSQAQVQIELLVLTLFENILRETHCDVLYIEVNYSIFEESVLVET